jgi:hypothetical protein
MVSIRQRVSGAGSSADQRHESPHRHRSPGALLSTYDEDAGAHFVAECGAAAYVTKSAFGPDRLRDVWKWTERGKMPPQSHLVKRDPSADLVNACEL